MPEINKNYTFGRGELSVREKDGSWRKIADVSSFSFTPNHGDEPAAIEPAKDTAVTTIRMFLP